MLAALLLVRALSSPANGFPDAVDASSPEEEECRHGGRAGHGQLRDQLFAHVMGDDHWKISVVQSPFWSRASCACAGWKSTKKSRSTSMPPFGSQFTRSSQERRPG